MQKVNTNDLAEEAWSSPKGKFTGAGKQVSEALGRQPQSTDLNERHPFDVEIARIPPGLTPGGQTQLAWSFTGSATRKAEAGRCP